MQSALRSSRQHGSRASVRSIASLALVAAVGLGACSGDGDPQVGAQSAADQDASATSGVEPSGAAGVSGATQTPPTPTPSPAPSGETTAPTDPAIEDAAATLPVAPPEGEGDLSVVQVEPQESHAPVAAEDTVVVAAAIRASIVLGETTVQARRPGEIGGEAVEVALRLSNEGTLPQDLADVFVTVEDKTGAPLPPLYGEPYSPLEGGLAPGESAEGSYVFTHGDSVRQPLTVRISYTADEPAAVFVGTTQ